MDGKKIRWLSWTGLAIWAVFIVVGALSPSSSNNSNLSASFVPPSYSSPSFFNKEVAGDVKYNDCREKLYLKSDTWQKYYKKFVCSYYKTVSDKIEGGECVHVSTNSEGMCEAASVYQRKSDFSCPSSHPYIDVSDEKCYAEWQVGRYSVVTQ